MKHKRHWSFIVTDKRYLYSFVIKIVLIGCTLSYLLKDPSQFSRVGNLIIGVGVWMSMRYTFREGIKRNKNALDDSPTLPGPGHMRQVNPNFFNKKYFQIGDAIL